ncbi:MAG: carboxypeptidase-like regulatory domain-containing protein [Pirellulales bacterium]
MNTRLLRGVAWVSSVAIIFLVGCAQSEPTGTVSGTVTLEGEPVTAGVVSFISEAGSASMGNIGSDGSFTLDGELPVGKYTVSVSPPELTMGPDDTGDKLANEMPASPIPGGYYDESSSDIVKEVTEGDNSITIELKASGPAA